MTRHVIARRFRNGRRERRVAAISKWGESAEKLIEQKEKKERKSGLNIYEVFSFSFQSSCWRGNNEVMAIDFSSASVGSDGDGSASERFISSFSSSHEYRERNLPS